MFYQNNSDKTTSHSHKEESDASITSVSSCQTETKSQRVLLQTASVVARYNKQFRNCPLLADTAEQRSFVERKFSRLLKLPDIRKEKLSIYSFGDKSPVEKTLNVVKIRLENKDDPNSLEIEALETEKISAAHIPPPDIEISIYNTHLKGLELADTTNSDTNVSVLIGADNYFDVIDGAVIRHDGSSSKLIIIFDASSHKRSKFSLNDSLRIGSKLYPDLFELLLSFRKHPIAFTVGIKQAFLNVELDDSDKNATKFFWTDNPEFFSESLEVLRLNRVLFEINSSPFLLTATIKYHLKKYSSLFPQTHELLNKFVYVDDVLGGQSTVASIYTTSVECVEIFNEANMPLQKWATNSVELRELWEKNGLSTETSSNSIGQNMINYKVLGISWDTDRNVFYFDIESLLSFISKRTDTKRFLLQVAGRIFDPLGFIAPHVIRLKTLIQNIWEMGLLWDQEMPLIIKKPFNEWCHELKDLHLVSIPRFYDFTDSNATNIQLH
ncbi:integrase catalytic domain-containing protein [Trichonephila clavipes]|nr:integrase catalytic domain-containing protein [Trichonephila clavipes]